MSDTDPGFPLPLIVDPPRICIQFEIPNEPFHIAAFLGNFLNLGYWFNWQRDSDHTGLAVSQIWYSIFQQVATQIYAGGNCPIDFGFPGADDGSDFMIRQNPDNPCLLESSVNGTDWCVFADISKCMNFGTQPGTGSTQPAQGGGSAQYCGKLNANDHFLLPTAINSGDIITLNDSSGATNDPDEAAGANFWRLWNGDIFFAGGDIGFPVTVGTDPLPATNHMQVILAIGNAPTYYPLTLGVPFTVPAGYINQPAWLQVNDGIIANDRGSLDICVTVQNNQTGAWSHTLDFTLSPQGFIPDTWSGGTPMGVWIGGSGYSANFIANDGSGHSERRLRVLRSAMSPAFNIDSMIAVVSFHPGTTIDSSAGQNFGSNNGGSYHVAYNMSPWGGTTGNHIHLGGTYSQTAQDGLWLDFFVSEANSPTDAGGTLFLEQIIITGHGTQPAW